MLRQYRLFMIVGAYLAMSSLASAACPTDLDSDGVCDAVDYCPSTSSGAVVDATGCPLPVPGDFNHDGDVDSDDLASMNACWSGPAVLANATPACQAADFDGDADVDMADFGAFQRCFSGTDNPASPTCQYPTAFIRNARLYIIGSAASDHLALRLKSGTPTILEIDFGDNGSADFSFDRAGFDHIVVGMGGGDDLVRIDQINGVFTDTEVTSINGGNDDDTLIGGSGAETFIGANGNDIIDGNPGNDTALLGAGDDIFVWDPGDGSDTIEGQAGADGLVFNASNAAEILDLSANGARLRLIRNVGSVIMDLDDVEHLDLHALGGADSITVRDLTGTDTTQVNLHLAGTLGGSVGDAQADTVIVNATDGNDIIAITGGGTAASITGLSAVVNITTAEAANDQLVVNAQKGDDIIQATGLASGVLVLTLNGGIGKDTLTGSHGADLLNGDDDNDTITGGDGNDTAQLGLGNDRFIWNPGDDTDIVEGNDGVDTVEVNGGNGDEAFSITANGTRVRFDRTNPAPFFLDIGTCENLLLNANGGNDTLACTGNLAALIQITADGGAGNDTLLGSNGVDVLLGGDGNDFVDGNQGNDIALLGADDDTFQWDPGDGSDTIEGQAGFDVLSFNASNIGEILDLSANGGRLRLTRNVGNIVLDVDNVEQATLNVLGGADTITINDLTGTDITQVNCNLAATGGIGDAQADNVIVNATNGDDTMTVAGNGTAASVSGLSAIVNITTAESAFDRLTINALAGADVLEASGLDITAIQLTGNGGAQDDILIGGAGNDTLSGGDGDDVLLGGPGVDVLDGGPGNNIVIQD